MQPAAAQTDPPPDPAPDADAVARRLLEIIGALVAESAPAGRAPVAPTLDSPLERDLGIDSLARRRARAAHRAGARRAAPRRDADRGARRRATWWRAVLRAAGVAHAPAGDRRGHAGRRRDLATPEGATTLVAMLEWHAERHPDRTHIRCSKATTVRRRGRMRGCSRRRGASPRGCSEEGIEPGQSVAIMLPTSREFFAAFFGDPPRGRRAGADLPAGPARRSSSDHLRRQAGDPRQRRGARCSSPCPRRSRSARS